MKTLTLDFETYFATDYSLSRADTTTESYVRDPQFKAHMVGIKWPGQPAANFLPHLLLTSTELRKEIEANALVAHNAAFDGLILAHHYNLKPAFWFDTLSMSRATLRSLKSHSLGNLAKHFNLPEKNVPYQLFKGLRHLPPDIYQLVAAGCEHDVNLTAHIFQLLLPYMPQEELRVVDATIRMFVQPCLGLDVSRATLFFHEEQRRKAEFMARAGVTEETLQSSVKFKEVLEAIGFPCPMKPSPTSGEPIPALAKNDDGMKALLEHEDTRVQALAAARLGVKSTLNETRAQRLIETIGRGALPVDLKYCGAHTTRWSGSGALNWQNFPRGGEIRKSILAPPGHKLVIGDLSQIEYRLLCWLAGQTDMLDALSCGRDLYSELATRFYGRTITRDDKPERGVGKQVTLSCLARGTLTVTNSGVKPIETVTEQDLLWDGTEWVRHQGVVIRGERIVMNLAGLWLTPDHRVLCGSSWVQAQHLQNEKLLCRSLARAAENLPSQVIKWGQEAVLSLLLFSVPVQPWSIPSTLTISLTEKLHAAIRALKRKLVTGRRNFTATSMFSLMKRIEYACSIEFPLVLYGATALRKINTMEGAAFAFTTLGAAIAKPSWPTSSRCPAGIDQNLRWIGSTPMDIMSRATSNFLHDLRTWQISVKSDLCKSVLTALKWNSTSCNAKMQTYDIVLSGANNRFTVLTKKGPLIVHNCGYGAGADSIVRTAALGSYGPPVKLTPGEGLRARDIYRGTHHRVAAMWKDFEALLGVLARGGQATYKVLAIDDGQIILPNGLALDYQGLEWHPVEGWRVPTRKGWSRLWGSKLVADTIQALARVVISQAMLKVLERIWIALTVHDELVGVSPDARAEEDLTWMLGVMKTPPHWCPDVPLDAEGLVSRSYDK